MKFVTCPHCGHKLLGGDAGSCVCVKCNKCKGIFVVTIQKDSVSVSTAAEQKS